MTAPASDAPPSRRETRTYRVGETSHDFCLSGADWAAFDDFCKRETLSGEQACGRAALRVPGETLTDKVVGLLTSYFKDATERNPPSSDGFSESDDAAPGPSAALCAGFDAVGRRG